jgi:hypothetical protein
MRLLNVATLKLEDTQIDRWYRDHRYAILSHYWDKEEVTFDDISTPRAITMAGYRKIQMSCGIAKRYGLKYMWIDTCCIDKRSSAELSEAINSMYNWYKDSTLCIAYLQDCETTDTFESCTTRSQVLRKVGGSNVDGRYRSFLHRPKCFFFKLLLEGDRIQNGFKKCNIS